MFMYIYIYRLLYMCLALETKVQRTFVEKLGGNFVPTSSVET